MNRYRILSGIVVSSILLNLFSCQKNHSSSLSGKTSEYDSVKSVINSSIGWAKDKDFKLLYSIISNDSNYLEVDPGPGIKKGFNQFKMNESFWGNPEFKAVRYDIRDLTINFSDNGDVAWFYCILDDINEWKGQPASWLNTRWTGVLEKRKGKWIIAQMHFSFAQEK
jgi:hypothetical protein